MSEDKKVELNEEDLEKVTGGVQKAMWASGDAILLTGKSEDTIAVTGGKQVQIPCFRMDYDSVPIRVRGGTSLTASNTPLIAVDGVIPEAEK